MKDYSTEPVTREELISLCRYYKGEKNNPYCDNPKEEYDNARAFVWYCEKRLCDELFTERPFFEGSYYREYIEHYPEFKIEENLPLILKSCILFMYLHKNEMPYSDEFKSFYKKWQSKKI